MLEIAAILDYVPSAVQALSCITSAITSYATGDNVDNQKLGITLESTLKAFVNLEYDTKIDELFKTFEFDQKCSFYKIFNNNLLIICNEKPEIIFSQECNHNGKRGKLRLDLNNIQQNMEFNIEISFVPLNGGTRQYIQIYINNNNTATKMKWFKNLCSQISHLKQKNFETLENLSFNNEQKITSAIVENTKSMLISILKNSGSSSDPMVIKTLELLKENCEKIKAIKK